MDFFLKYFYSFKIIIIRISILRLFLIYEMVNDISIHFIPFFMSYCKKDNEIAFTILLIINFKMYLYYSFIKSNN